MIRPLPRRARRGFTLMELLVTITLIAVMAALVVPGLSDNDRLRLSAASTVLTSDIELAQVMTITHPEKPVIVWFDSKYTYWLAYADTPDTPISRPDTGEPYLVELGKGRMAAAAGLTVMHIHFKNADGEKMLRFNASGGLDDFLSQPQLYLHIKDKSDNETHRITLNIAPTTGTITEI